jgi:hypothetical protein
MDDQTGRRSEALRAEADAVDALPPEFVTAITDAQIAANKGWRPEGKTLVDWRINHCPDCGAPGMNTCWGYWAFTCGAEVLSNGDIDEPCPNQSQNENDA